MASYSLNMAPEPLLFGFIARPPCAPLMNPKSRGSDAILRDLISAPLGCPIRPFEAPRSSTRPPKRRLSTMWWLGRSLPNLATHVAIFARNRVSARNADHTLTDIPWAAAGGKCLISSAAIRTMISDTAVARSARNGTKKAVECHFSWFWAVFSARWAAFAAAFAA